MKPICKNQNIKRRPSTYLALVEQIYNEPNRPQRYSGTQKSMLREFFSKTSKYRYTWKRETFRYLLIYLYNKKCYALLRSYKHVEALYNISAFGNKIIRDIENWEPNSTDKDALISSLIKYCFAKYDTPLFIETSFYESHKLYMLWYVQLGRGVSVKNLSQMPIKLTNRMAHEFRNAPMYFGVFEALRYAQAIGFGASKDVAKLIAFSSLSRTRNTDETFWTSVVRFFSQIECLETNELDQIVDYLTFKYREDNRFSMKGRTFNALLHQTNDWRRRMYINSEIENVLSWQSSGIKSLHKEEVIGGQKVVFKTIELCNSIELYDEGIEMQHCVAEYDEDCEAGQSRIFSLRSKLESETMKRLATIEVAFPSFEIVQVKAKYNQEPSKKVMTLINEWIEDSDIKSVKHEVPVQEPNNHLVMINGDSIISYDTLILNVLRLLIVLVYTYFVFGKLLNSISSSNTPDFKVPPISIEMTKKLDSMIKETYGVKPYDVKKKTL